VRVRTFTNPPAVASWSAKEAWRRAEIPASNGHGNARSVARVQAILSHGGEIDGTRYLSAAGCEAVFEEQSPGVDLVLGFPLTFGIGYSLHSEATPVGVNPRTCYWRGWGGSIVVNDLDDQLTVAYVMNRMHGGPTLDDRAGAVVTAALAAATASR